MNANMPCTTGSTAIAVVMVSPFCHRQPMITVVMVSLMDQTVKEANSAVRMQNV